MNPPPSFGVHVHLCVVDILFFFEQNSKNKKKVCGSELARFFLLEYMRFF